MLLAATLATDFTDMKPRGGILLVYPNITRVERYRGNVALFGGRQIPLGLFSLAAYLRKYGCRAEAIDAEAERRPPEAVVDRLAEGGFDALGISTTTAIFHRALDLARMAKARLPGMPVIVGGPHVSSQPLHPMAFGAFDYAIPREGEETLLETLEAIHKKAGFEGVRGLVHRRDGLVVANPPRPYVQDIDSLPTPAYDLIPDITVYSPPPFNYRRRPVANIMTSRGCPNECTFCERATFGRKLRMRSAASVVAELELLLRRFHVREIAFSDDTFTVDADRIREIFDLAARSGLRFPWSCKSRINTVDEELLRYMKANGCWHIAFGIESGDPQILEGIRKNIKLPEVERVIDMSHRAGLVTKGFFILGHPQESFATIERSVELALRLKLDQVAVSLNTPLPGTEQYRYARENGQLDESSWSAFSFWCPVFVPAGMTRRQLVARHRDFLRRFYMRPKWLSGQALSMLSHPRTFVQVWYLARDYARLAGERMSLST